MSSVHSRLNLPPSKLLTPTGVKPPKSLEIIESILKEYSIITDNGMTLQHTAAGRSTYQVYSLGYYQQAKVGDKEQATGPMLDIRVFANQPALLKFSYSERDGSLPNPAEDELRSSLRAAQRVLEVKFPNPDKALVGRFFILRHFKNGKSRTLSDDEIISLVDTDIPTRLILTLIHSGATAAEVIENQELPASILISVFNGVPTSTPEEEDEDFFSPRQLPVIRTRLTK